MHAGASMQTIYLNVSQQGLADASLNLSQSKATSAVSRKVKCRACVHGVSHPWLRTMRTPFLLWLRQLPSPTCSPLQVYQLLEEMCDSGMPLLTESGILKVSTECNSSLQHQSFLQLALHCAEMNGLRRCSLDHVRYREFNASSRERDLAHLPWVDTARLSLNLYSRATTQTIVVSAGAFLCQVSVRD